MTTRPFVNSATDVVNAIADINSAKGDSETAHLMEDELYAQVLGAVVAGHPEAKQMARYALKTKDISFARWYA